MKHPLPKTWYDSIEVIALLVITVALLVIWKRGW